MDAKSPPTRADEARVNKDVIMPYMTTIKTPASAEDSVAALMKEIETNARHPLTSSSDVPYKSSMTGSRQALAIEPSDIFTVDTVSDDNRNISIAERVFATLWMKYQNLSLLCYHLPMLLRHPIDW
jgi:hypothetical protein